MIDDLATKPYLDTTNKNTKGLWRYTPLGLVWRLCLLTGSLGGWSGTLRQVAGRLEHVITGMSHFTTRGHREPVSGIEAHVLTTGRKNAPPYTWPGHLKSRDSHSAVSPRRGVGDKETASRSTRGLREPVSSIERLLLVFIGAKGRIQFNCVMWFYRG